MPAMLALQDTVVVPEPGRLGGAIAPQMSPVGIVSDKVTVPLKWFSAAMVIVTVADCVTSTEAGVVADVVKSWNRKIAVVEWLRVPLVPVSVTV